MLMIPHRRIKGTENLGRKTGQEVFCYAEEVSLERLSCLTGLSRYYPSGLLKPSASHPTRTSGKCGLDAPKSCQPQGTPSPRSPCGFTGPEPPPPLVQTAVPRRVTTAIASKTIQLKSLPATRHRPRDFCLRSSAKGASEVADERY